MNTLPWIPFRLQVLPLTNWSSENLSFFLNYSQTVLPFCFCKHKMVCGSALHAGKGTALTAACSPPRDVSYFSSFSGHWRKGRRSITNCNFEAKAAANMSEIFQKLRFTTFYPTGILSLSDAFVKLPKFSLTCKMIRNTCFPIKRQAFPCHLQVLVIPWPKQTRVSEGVRKGYSSFPCTLRTVTSFNGNFF